MAITPTTRYSLGPHPKDAHSRDEPRDTGQEVDQGHDDGESAKGDDHSPTPKNVGRELLAGTLHVAVFALLPAPGGKNEYLRDAVYKEHEIGGRK